VGLQRIAELSQQRRIVAKESCNTRLLRLFFQQVKNVLMIRHKKITRGACDLFVTADSGNENDSDTYDLPSLYMNSIRAKK